MDQFTPLYGLDSEIATRIGLAQFLPEAYPGPYRRQVFTLVIVIQSPNLAGIKDQCSPFSQSHTQISHTQLLHAVSDDLERKPDYCAAASCASSSAGTSTSSSFTSN